MLRLEKGMASLDKTREIRAPFARSRGQPLVNRWKCLQSKLTLEVPDPSADSSQPHKPAVREYGCVYLCPHSILNARAGGSGHAFGRLLQSSAYYNGC
jgi:hypothetical protein